MTSESTEVEVYLCPLHPGACSMANGHCDRCGTPLRIKPERLARLQRVSRLFAYGLAAASVIALIAMALS